MPRFVIVYCVIFVSCLILANQKVLYDLAKRLTCIRLVFLAFVGFEWSCDSKAAKQPQLRNTKMRQNVAQVTSHALEPVVSLVCNTLQSNDSIPQSSDDTPQY